MNKTKPKPRIKMNKSNTRIEHWYKNENDDWFCRHITQDEADLISLEPNFDILKWFRNELLHRIDGPAILCWGNPRWFINGVEFYDISDFVVAAKWTDKQLADFLLRN